LYRRPIPFSTPAAFIPPAIGADGIAHNGDLAAVDKLAVVILPIHARVAHVLRNNRAGNQGSGEKATARTARHFIHPYIGTPWILREGMVLDRGAWRLQDWPERLPILKKEKEKKHPH
jgi:hypothetical protein